MIEQEWLDDSDITSQTDFKELDIPNKADDSVNNGGTTSYYDIDPEWKIAQDIIEARGMNFSQGNIFKVGFTLNLGRHDGTDYERELNKLIFFAKREKKRIRK